MERSMALRARPVRTPRQKVVIVGLGPIGVELARLVLTHRDAFELVGAVDRAAHLVGKPLGALCGPKAPRRRVMTSAAPAPGGEALAFLTTTSSLRGASATVLELLERGYHVVSSTEELSYPALREPRLAAELDRAARRARRSVVGTGINPGCAMDVWPVILASNAQTLERVQVTRIVDASMRRGPLQRKIGAGMRPDEFETLARAGRIGHVGLVESCAHMADLLGWALDRVQETLVPKLARRRLRTAHVDVRRGSVCGIHHRAVGHEGKIERIILDLQMFLGAENPRDEVSLQGNPPIHCTVAGGFHGDLTTAAQLVSAAAHVPAMPPGLHLASELPVPRRPARRVQLVLSGARA